MTRPGRLPWKASVLALTVSAVLLASAHAEPPRAKFVYTHRFRGVIIKDGTAFPVGSYWGKELLEIFPEGTGEAHRLAKEYVRKKRSAGTLKIAGIVMLVGFLPAMGSNSNIGRWTGLGLLVTGIGCTIGARVQRDYAYADFFRAINAFNETPLGSLGPPGPRGLAAAPQGLLAAPGTLSLGFAQRF